MSKELFIEAHEQLIAELLEARPGVTWEAAYELTADRAYNRMRDNLADKADALRSRSKE